MPVGACRIGALLFGLLAAGAPAYAQTVIYRPADKPPALSYQAAKAYFAGCGSAVNRSIVASTQILDDGFEWTMKDGRKFRFLHQEMGNPYVGQYGFFGDMYNVQGHRYAMATDGPGRVLYQYSDRQEEVARRCADALYVLRKGVPAEDPAELARFNEEAKQYREASVKPPFPEEARRYRVQAETAVSEKRFDDAIARYEEALKLASWWPEGRFNRALMLGEVKRYTEAIREMKKYLVLAPDAANARAAQDQIYAWEDKAGRK